MTDDPIQILTADQGARASFDWGELTWFANAELGNSGELTLGRCVLRPHSANPRHYHPNCSEILVVLQGRIAHTGPGDAPVTMNVGDTVTIPPRVWHQARNLGDSDAVLLIAFNSAHRETVGE